MIIDKLNTKVIIHIDESDYICNTKLSTKQMIYFYNVNTNEIG